MARGGARPGAGRKTGALTKKTRAVAEAIVAAGSTPLDTLNKLRVWSEGLFDKAVAEEDQAAALAAAEFAADIATKQAPFVHPKLSAIQADHSSSDGSMSPRPTVIEFVAPDAGDD